MAKFIDDDIKGPEDIDSLQRDSHKIVYEGCNSRDANEVAAASGDLPFGSYAVAKDKGSDTLPNENRALVSELFDDRGDPVGIELSAIDSSGNSEALAEIVMNEFSKGGDIAKMVDNVLQTLESESDVPAGSKASFAFVRVLNNKAEVATCGTSRVTIWDKAGNIIFKSKDESLLQDSIDSKKNIPPLPPDGLERFIPSNSITKGSPNTLREIYPDIELPEGAFIKVSTKVDSILDKDEKALERMTGESVINGVKKVHILNKSDTRNSTTIAYIHAPTTKPDSRKIAEDLANSRLTGVPLPGSVPSSPTSAPLPPPRRRDAIPPAPRPLRVPAAPAPSPVRVPPAPSAGVPPVPPVAPASTVALAPTVAPAPTPAEASIVPDDSDEDLFSNKVDDSQKTLGIAALVAAGLIAAGGATVYALGDKDESTSAQTHEVADTVVEVDQLSTDLVNAMSNGPIDPDKVRAMLLAADEAVKFAKASNDPYLIQSADTLDALKTGIEIELNVSK